MKFKWLVARRYEEIKYEKMDGIAKITINRPQVRNAFRPRTVKEMLQALEDGLKPHLPISVLLLGMGADMHMASLFPGADRLEEALAPDAPVLMALRAEAAGEPRITLTAPVLAGAQNIHILITGAEKRAAIERAASLPALEAPVRVVLDNATVHWAE